MITKLLSLSMFIMLTNCTGPTFVKIICGVSHTPLIGELIAQYPDGTSTVNVQFANSKYYITVKKECVVKPN